NQPIDHQKIIRIGVARADVNVAVGDGGDLELDGVPQRVAIGRLGAGVQLGRIAVGTVSAKLVAPGVDVPGDAVGRAVGGDRGRRSRRSKAVGGERLRGGADVAAGDGERFGHPAKAVDVIQPAVEDCGGAERPAELIRQVLHDVVLQGVLAHVVAVDQVDDSLPTRTDQQVRVGGAAGGGGEDGASGGIVIGGGEPCLIEG